MWMDGYQYCRRVEIGDVYNAMEMGRPRRFQALPINLSAEITHTYADVGMTAARPALASRHLVLR